QPGGRPVRCDAEGNCLHQRRDRVGYPGAKGVAEMYAEKGNHIITAATEHKAILDTCKRLEKHGTRVTYLPVQQNGLVDLDQLKAAITDKTVLISIMHANNEIGVLQPIREIGRIARERGVMLHTGGTQA